MTLSLSLCMRRITGANRRDVQLRIGRTNTTSGESCFHSNTPRLVCLTHDDSGLSQRCGRMQRPFWWKSLNRNWKWVLFGVEHGRTVSIAVVQQIVRQGVSGGLTKECHVNLRPLALQEGGGEPWIDERSSSEPQHIRIILYVKGQPWTWRNPT